jgi:galactonate dehydratase
VKIESISTLRLDEYPNLLWLLIKTDEGLVGLGETYLGASAVEAYVHDTAAPYLLGKDPLTIEAHSRMLYGYLGFTGSGVEMRGNSAVDIALWDLLGKSTGQPLFNLLGGRVRDRIRVYNTCAGYDYGRTGRAGTPDSWGLSRSASARPYEDLDAFLHRAGELALSLLEQGITGMKIWPFDAAAVRNGGQYILHSELEDALEPFKKIREAVGLQMDVMVEFHSLWSPLAARGLFAALEQFTPYWFEDPIKADDFDALAALASSSKVPIAASETLAGAPMFGQLIDKRAADVVMFDLCWAGGFTHGRKIASSAEIHGLPIACHDCTGPVTLTASTHLDVSAPNALIQEVVRAYYFGWYQELVTSLPELNDGFISPPTGPGLGVELAPELVDRRDAHLRTSVAHQ